MEYNPYTPPKTITELPVEQGAAPRPIAVWLMMALLVVVGVFNVTTLVTTVRSVIANWNLVQKSTGLIVLGFTVQLAVIAFFVWATYSLFRGKAWSRWLGVILIALMMLYIIFRPDTTIYDNSARRIGSMTARYGVIPLFYGWWLYAFSLSPKAKRFFSSASANAS